VSNEFTYERINDYSAVKISLAKTNDIRGWSYGEVKKPETINYRTYRPERDGLFCEKIFGPEKDWECACGKYRGMKYKGMTCDRCGVKITHSRVRRKRMGHIDLAAPVVHIWFFKAASSRLATLLEMKASSLEKVIYFQDYAVIDPGETSRKVGELLNEDEYRKCREEDTSGRFHADMGAEAIRKLLQNLDLVQLSEDLREAFKETKSKQRKKDIINRLKLVEALRDSDNKPEWMVLDVIPVIPPDLRPLVLLESGTFATSDLNDLYRRIINRNSRLKKLQDLNAPEVIIRNEKRMLQQSVDALFDNNRCRRPVLGSSNRPLKSITDMIKGKQGRFRENLLGKRVDYSARSVIVVGPHLRLHQCGLPKKIALELFQPFIIRRLKELQHADTIKSAKKMLERRDEEVWDILEEVIQNHPVLLNRAPTLHRMGIQAFEPVLVEGNAIKLHPLVCRGFNADFDGDQMAVHLPLSLEAQVEAHTLMLSTNNIFSPANGSPIISPSQDVVMGAYYLTMTRPDVKGEGMKFASREEVLLAYAHGKVNLHAKIKVRMPKGRWLKTDRRVNAGKIFDTTPGRIIFNDILPEGMPYYDETLRSAGLQAVISDCHEYIGRRGTIDLLDRLMRLGFEASTQSGLSFATDDLVTPEKIGKAKIIEEAEKKVDDFRRHYEDGLIAEGERYNNVLDTWTNAREEITANMMKAFETDDRKELGWQEWYVNPIYLMAVSGARGGQEQIRQLAGMRGLMAKPSGKIIEAPIKANFRKGLNVLEYFSSTHGARKGLADTALKTADSGYMTRKLADVAQNVVVTMDDCGTTQGITKETIRHGDKVVVSLGELIKGRVSRTNIVNLLTDEPIVRENEVITSDIVRKIEELGLEKIQIRSPMTCEAELGVCARCYGMDLSTNQLVELGLAVGIIAAQSIGEPGTQLTMRTFHIGGTAARDAEKREIDTKVAGTAKFVKIDAVESEKGQRSLTRDGEIAVLDPKGRELTKSDERIDVPLGAELYIKDGDQVYPAFVLRIDMGLMTASAADVNWSAPIMNLITEKGIKTLAELAALKEEELGNLQNDKERIAELEEKLREASYRFGSISAIRWSIPIQNLIRERNVKTLAELAKLAALKDEELEKLKLDERRRRELREKLKETGYTLGMGLSLLALTPEDVAGDKRSLFSVTELAVTAEEGGRRITSLTINGSKVQCGTLPRSGDHMRMMVVDGADGKGAGLGKQFRITNAGLTIGGQSATGGQFDEKLKSRVLEIELCPIIGERDPHSEPILAKVNGTVQHVNIIEGVTVRREIDHTGKPVLVVRDYPGDQIPQIDITSKDGKETLEYYYLPVGAIIQVEDKQTVQRGHMLAKRPRGVGKTQDITGGLPRVTEIFEARKPKDPAVIAEIDGIVKLGPKRHGKRTIVVVNEETGAERNHEISQGKHLLVQPGDSVKVGESLTDGSHIPHDILRISGVEKVQEYLVHEVQNVYRSQRVKINDKHIELIISQMLRKVRIESAGDTKLLEGVQVDRFQFSKANKEISECVKIVDPGGTRFEPGEVVLREVFEQENDATEAEAASSGQDVQAENEARIEVIDPGDTELQAGTTVTCEEFDLINQKLAAENETFVRVTHPGDTDLKADTLVPREEFDQANKELVVQTETLVQITDPGGSKWEHNAVITREEFNAVNAEIRAAQGKAAKGKKVPKGRAAKCEACKRKPAKGKPVGGVVTGRRATCEKTKLAKASTQLLGITKAAVQASSFISAASFQETTKVLTEAALASRTDNLIGLKENVILGHLIPAGTGFKSYQNAQWKLKDETAVAFDAMKAPAAPRDYALLNDLPDVPPMSEAEHDYTTQFLNEPLSYDDAAYDNDAYDDDIIGSYTDS